MGKLKEKLLNNLSEQEMNEQFELSAFEFVEYIENYKQKQSEELPNDVINQIAEEQKRLEQEFYEQEEINELNQSNKLKYTDNDILNVLESYGVDPHKIELIMSELNVVWNTKNGFFE